MSRWAAILAGGSGTRFWPLSTPRRPKQLLSLTGTQPLLVQAIQRLQGLIPPSQILVITAESLVTHIRALLPEVPAANVLGEPRAASTAPALTWATVLARSRDPKATVLSLHADWYVGDDEAFRDSAGRALDVAEGHDMLVTVGIVPTRPETGYGYIEPGEPLDSAARRVDRFVEKPDQSQAEALLERGALWNSGLFAWTAQRFLAETRQHVPEIAPHLGRLDERDVSAFFDLVTPIAVDVSHFERSSRVAVLPGAFLWDDVGTWNALVRVRPRDAAENVLVGEAVQRDTQRSVVWAEQGAVVVDGVHDLVVVSANGIVLVTTRERARDLKSLLAELPNSLKEVST